MPNTLGEMANLPDLDFIEGKTLEDFRDEMIADFESYMKDTAGEPFTLDRADPHRAEINACAVALYQALAYIDRSAKRNTLKYSYGEWLDHLGQFKTVTRTAASAATATLRFTLSAARISAVGIPAGTRVAHQGEDVYFAVTEYAEIPAGETYIDVTAECLETGETGNGFAAGELDTIVDPIPYVQSVENLAETEGGSEEEADDAYALRAYLAPSKYAAGTAEFYYYRAISYSTAIGEVAITSNQKAGTVDIVFLEADGSSPGEELCGALQEYMRTEDGHLMNDLVTCAAPEEVEYTINFTYYIKSSDSSRAETIQAAVNAAVEQYQTEQCSIGKDIVPDDLIDLVKGAGAKRLNITDSTFAPVFTKVGATQVGKLAGEAAVTYGGLEDG